MGCAVRTVRTPEEQPKSAPECKVPSGQQAVKLNFFAFSLFAKNWKFSLQKKTKKMTCVVLYLFVVSHRNPGDADRGCGPRFQIQGDALAPMHPLFRHTCALGYKWYASISNMYAQYGVLLVRIAYMFVTCRYYICRYIPEAYQTMPSLRWECRFSYFIFP